MTEGKVAKFNEYCTEVLGVVAVREDYPYPGRRLDASAHSQSSEQEPA